LEYFNSWPRVLVRKRLEEAYSALRRFRSDGEAEDCYTFYREELQKNQYESALRALGLLTEDEDTTPPAEVLETLVIAAESLHLEKWADADRRMKAGATEQALNKVAGAEAKPHSFQTKTAARCGAARASAFRPGEIP